MVVKCLPMTMHFFRTNFGRYNADEDEDGESGVRGGRFRSRFLRPDDDDDTAGNRKSMHFDDDTESKSVIKKERIKVRNPLNP